MIFAKRKPGKCGKRVRIERNVRLKNPKKIKIGNNVHLRAGCQLYVQHNTMDKDKMSCEYAIQLGDDVHIKENANLSTYGGSIVIGNRSNIGQNCVLYGQGGIVIGEDVLIAPNCVIVSGSHKFENPEIPINKQGTYDQGIVIEDDVWVGANVSILDGVRIGKGCVIGAGSVVTKDLAEYSIAYGSPAKARRKRGDRLE